MNNAHGTNNRSLSLTERRAEWDGHYRNGFTPWDTYQVPPEVCTFWESGLLPKRGRAVDIGCGTGTNARYLQELGLFTISIDLTSVGIAMAQNGNHSTDESRTRGPAFVQADAAALPLCSLNAQYILDIGCFHSIPRHDRIRYAEGVINNLAAGGYYHIYAHCPQPPEHSRYSKERGLTPEEVRTLFEPALMLLTVVQNKPGLRAARWYLLHKPGK